MSPKQLSRRAMFKLTAVVAATALAAPAYPWARAASPDDLAGGELTVHLLVKHMHPDGERHTLLTVRIDEVSPTLAVADLHLEEIGDHGVWRDPGMVVIPGDAARSFRRHVAAALAEMRTVSDMARPIAEAVCHA